MHFDVKFEPPQSYTVQMDVHDVVLENGFESVQVVNVAADPYTGEYEVTPDQQAKTLETKNKTMLHNVVVRPIPGNYGRVTYDQTKTITVS